MSDVVFEEELLERDPQIVLLHEDDAMDLPKDIADKLKNDPSQLQAAEAALKQCVTLIQGPPGTGKTFVGVQIVRALLKADPNIRIMCLCYTNHALDSFLESLIDTGIHKKKIARLGNAKRISEKIQDCVIHRQDCRRFDRTEGRLNFAFYRTKDDLRAEIKRYSQELQQSLDHKSWDLVQEKVPDMYARYPQLLEQFEVRPEEEGMQIVGKKGKALREDSGWSMWCDGEKQPHFVRIAKGSPNLWDLPKDKRLELLQKWEMKLKKNTMKNFISAVKRFNKVRAEHADLQESSRLSVLEERSIVAATTTFAAKNRGLLDSYAADVLIVEEAAEILEAHVLTNLGPSLSQLVMIGDHKQLRPKLEHYPLRVDSGQGINFDQSLFERLVRSGYPHFTLQVQHRMRPQISRYIKSTYPELKDHASTKNRESIRGVSQNVAFINHSYPENSPQEDALMDSNSKVNLFEVQMVMKMLRYFLQQGYSGKDIVVLTPYLGQLRELRREMSLRSSAFAAEMNEMDESDLRKEEQEDNVEDVNDNKKDGNNAAAAAAATKIRIATVDNFQGEESKIIIASLVRANDRGEIGFVSGPERVNVLFSRARDGFFLLGNAETFENARSSAGRALWRDLLQRLRDNRCVVNGFPAKCATHGVEQLLDSPQAFDEKCPDGGCTQPCEAVLASCPWQHLCRKKCHPRDSHDKMSCTTVVEEICARGLHAQRRVCCAPAMACMQNRQGFCQPAGHLCSFPCYLSKIPSCNRCEKMKKEKEAKEKAHQAEIDALVAGTQRLTLASAEVDKEYDQEIHKVNESSKQRAMKETTEAAKKTGVAAQTIVDLFRPRHLG